MPDGKQLIGLLDDSQDAYDLTLTAEGRFHVVLGTKDEHDGIKVYASNPRVVEELLTHAEFRIETYYCLVSDSEEGKTFDPDEFDEAYDRVETITAVDGMLPYGAVTIEKDGESLDIGSLIGKLA